MIQLQRPRSPSGLNALVDGLFDYAGMFPPAQLDLHAALRESARFPRSLKRPFIVAADLVIPYGSLAEISRDVVQQAGFAQTRCSLCVVGVDVAQLDQAVAAVAAFNQTQGPLLRVVALEVHGDTFPRPAIRAARGALGAIRLFLEPRWAPRDWTRKLPALMATLEALKSDGAPVGLKVRGVGPTAVNNQSLARIIPAVASIPVPFKATQGLHHPVAGPDNPLGFLNLTAALRLSQTRRLTPRQTLHLLSDQEPLYFDLAAGLSWRDQSMSVDALRLARGDLPFTIGSCSLKEPDDDLARLWPEV